MTREFTWRDGERTIHFRAGVIADSPEILAGHGFEGYELLTTERAMGAAPVELAEDAACFHHVPPGPGERGRGAPDRRRRRAATWSRSAAGG